MQNIATFCPKVDYFEAHPLMVNNEIQTLFMRNFSKLSENTAVHDFLQQLLGEKVFRHEFESLDADCSLSDGYVQSLVRMKENNQIQALTQGIIQAQLEELAQESLAITNVFPHFNKNVSLLHEQSMVQRLAEQITAQPASTADALLPPPNAKLAQAFALQLSAFAEQKLIYSMAQGLAENPLTNLETNVLEKPNTTFTNDYAKWIGYTYVDSFLSKRHSNKKGDENE